MNTAFTFDEKTTALLDNLKQDLGVASQSDVLRKAIALLKLAQQVQNKGGQVVLEDADGAQSTLVLS